VLTLENYEILVENLKKLKQIHRKSIPYIPFKITIVETKSLSIIFIYMKIQVDSLFSLYKQ
jgi:hypothetical protein